MTKKVLILITIFLCNITSSCEPTVKKTIKNEWVDSLQLFDVSIGGQAKYLRKLIDNGLSIDTNSTLDAVENIINKKALYQIMCLRFLLQYKTPSYLEMIKKYGHLFDLDKWETTAFDLRTYGKFTEKDTAILNAFLSAVVKSKPENVHYEIVSFLSERGGFKIAKTFSGLLNKDFSNECKHNFLDCMVKFIVPEFDSIIKTYLNPKSYNDTIVPGVLFDIDANERYDLLPELKTLRSSLKSGKIKTEDETLFGKIDEYITNLEQKKTENAPIGLPLDWPKSGPPNKWSGM